MEIITMEKCHERDDWRGRVFVFPVPFRYFVAWTSPSKVRCDVPIITVPEVIRYHISSTNTFCIFFFIFFFIIIFFYYYFQFYFHSRLTTLNMAKMGCSLSYHPTSSHEINVFTNTMGNGQFLVHSIHLEPTQWHSIWLDQWRPLRCTSHCYPTS